MQGRTDISVITPAFNSELYISETIESVIKQSYRNWEMIIVDDGSRDSTESIVKAYILNDSRIRYYRLPSNSGRPAVPRNYAIDKSVGDYLAFLDADDIWLPEKLEYQLELMKSNDLELSYGPTESSTNGGYMCISKLRNRGVLVKEGNIACLTVMIRNRKEYRPIFDDEPFLKAAEDTYAWIQLCAKTNRVGIYDRCLSIYRDNAENSILKEFNSNPFRRMAKQYLYYSKLYLTGAISNREAIVSYCRVFYRNIVAWLRMALVSCLKKHCPLLRRIILHS